MTSKVLVTGVMAAVLAIGGAVQATPISVETTGADFGTLLGGSLTLVGSPLTSDFSGGSLSADVVSAVFTNGEGSYLYLYQVNNIGAPNTDSIIRFTTGPITQGSSQISLGYLTANVPAPFVSGNQTPLYGDIDATSGPTVGFDFPVGYSTLHIPDSFIGPGKSSMVLYIESTLSPGLVTGNIIDGQVRANQVIGPVPEPGTLVLLLAAGLGALAYVLQREMVPLRWLTSLSLGKRHPSGGL